MVDSLHKPNSSGPDVELLAVVRDQPGEQCVIRRIMKTFKIPRIKATANKYYVAVAYSLICPACSSRVHPFTMNFDNQTAKCWHCETKLRFKFY